MFHGKFTKFECNFCNKIEYDPPNSWMWISHGMGHPIEHACPECINKIPPGCKKHYLGENGVKHNVASNMKSTSKLTGNPTLSSNKENKNETYKEETN